MRTSPMWLESKCSTGMWLHDWLILRQMPDGLEEYCNRCGKVKLFRNNCPNDEYLAYHLRSALQPSLTEFFIEYPKFI